MRWEGIIGKDFFVFSPSFSAEKWPKRRIERFAIGARESRAQEENRRIGGERAGKY